MPGLRYMVHTSAEKTMTIVETPTAPAASRSPWHSPVPYLFGGLAAMLGLIAFALLILACSYWRLSGFLEGENNNNNNNDRDLEAGESINGDESEKQNKKLAPPQFLVIMPGQEKPTCLATPMTSSRVSSFGSSSCSSSSSSTDDGTEKSIPSDGEENEDQKKQDENGSTTTVTHTHTQQLEMTNLAMETVDHDTAAHDDDGGQVQ